MAISLDLEPDLEQRLRDMAEARGLSAEGYLITLIEALTEPDAPPRSRLHAAWHTLLRKESQQRHPRTIADAAARRMKADLLLHKERTIEAVAMANLLAKTLEKLQTIIAEKELQALTLAREGNAQALARFQESCVYGENLQFTKALLDSASGEAEELLLAFKQEEKRVQARLSPTQAGVLKAVDNEFSKTSLSGEQMDRRIFALGSAEEWQERFAGWIGQIAERAEPMSRADLD